ncbi:PaaI family thioesterase [Acidimicrobiia bacterium EGI L10123]|uniref:PaaI family thioesterase n=1 Tax=Salinilacustrithrix flava TaxID=2957203 RepID=UPI003D7C1B0D|nr:PaaI family thioesterase [Acidimicrobiia bacterium EGI L10123]
MTETSGTASEADDYGQFPLRGYLEMDVGPGEAGHARATLQVGAQHLNPNGVVHGAVLFAMVDTAMGSATMSMLPEGQHCASVDVQLRFIRPASAGDLVADVEVLKRGRAVAHLEGRVVDGEGRLVATAAGTFAVITV